MKIVLFKTKRGAGVGVQTSAGVINVTEAAGGSLQSLIQGDSPRLLTCGQPLVHV